MERWKFSFSEIDNQEREQVRIRRERLILCKPTKCLLSTCRVVGILTLIAF